MDQFVSKVEHKKLKEVYEGLKNNRDDLRGKCAKLVVDNSQGVREEELEKQLN